MLAVAAALVKIAPLRFACVGLEFEGQRQKLDWLLWFPPSQNRDGGHPHPLLVSPHFRIEMGAPLLLGIWLAMSQCEHTVGMGGA